MAVYLVDPLGELKKVYAYFKGSPKRFMSKKLNRLPQSFKHSILYFKTKYYLSLCVYPLPEESEAPTLF